jgi:hypothetical protein
VHPVAIRPLDDSKNLPTYGEIEMTVEKIFNVTFALVFFVVALALMLAYFDCLVK